MRFISTIVHLLSFATILIFGPYSLFELGQVAFFFFIGWVAIELVYRKAMITADRSLMWTMNSIVGFYLFAYPFKFAAGLFLAEGYWVVPGLITAPDLIAAFPDAYLLSTIGLVALIAGMIFSPFKSTLVWRAESSSVRFRTLFLLSLLMLVAKFYLKSTFSLGIPGVEPADMGVPYLSGVVTLVIHGGSLAFFNLLLFFALAKRQMSLAMIGLAIAFLNALIDLRFGSKGTVLYQLVITVIYLFMLRTAVPLGVRGAFNGLVKKIGVVLSIVGLVILSSYRYVNLYRDALNSGYDISSAITFALNSDHAASKSSIMEVANRIIGIETLGALVPQGQRLVADTGFVAMLDGSFVSSFTYQILGSDDALTKFSVTQFAYFYYTGGYAGLILGFFALGLLFTACLSILARMTINESVKLACLPVLWVLFVNILMGGGNFFLTFKELSAVLVMFYIWGRITCKNPSSINKSGVMSSVRPRHPQPTN